MRLPRLLASILIVSGIAVSQTTVRPRAVRASGEGVVSAQPNQAKLNAGVVTQAASAQEAASTNAAQLQTVLSALGAVLKDKESIKTIAYSLGPNYRYPQGSPPVLTGYTATNTLEITINDLNLVGRIIDTATQAGANNVSGLRFTVQDDSEFRKQALGLAAKRARADADAIAGGLGLRTGSVIWAEEGSITVPISVRADTAAAAPTPILPGLVEIRATVTVEVELTATGS